MKTIFSVDQFKEFVSSVQSENGYRNPIGFGICRVDLGQNSGNVLQANYPVVNWGENLGSAAIFISALKESGVDVDFSGTEFVSEVSIDFINSALAKFLPFIPETVGDKHRNIQVIEELRKNSDDLSSFRVAFIFEDEALKSVEATYLKLYALSQKKAPLRSLNLNGAFGVLQNVAWVGNKPYELQYLRDNEIKLKMSGNYPNIDSVDKFPRFLQHIIPEDNTRVLEASKVRMGASLAAGTTVMPGASYINFNAGTTGVSMVEGRISSSAIVGDGSDVGGGASILGVLSGTNGNPITIGENCLLGANSVCGVPLADGGIIDAGIAVLEGTKVTVSADEVAKLQSANPDFDFGGKTEFKASELATVKGVHYRQNSKTGQIIAFRSVREIKLNEDLH